MTAWVREKAGAGCGGRNICSGVGPATCMLSAEQQVHLATSVTFATGPEALGARINLRMPGPPPALSERPIRALGIKYGQHGDTSALTVAQDGVLVAHYDLADLWRVATQRFEQTKPTINRLDGTRRAGHPGGFCDACDGATVTTAGVCEVCDLTAEQLRQAWAYIAKIVDTSSAGFDLGVLAAAVQDESSADTAVFTSLHHAFPGLPWGLVNEYYPEPALALWHEYAELSSSGPAAGSRGVAQQEVAGNVVQQAGTHGIMRALVESGAPFSVCRPGFGWELTLSHRHRFGQRWPHRSDPESFEKSRQATITEVQLLHQHTGVYSLPQHNASHREITAHMRGYFERWNEAMDQCDVMATFPATMGRVSSYLRPHQAAVPASGIMGCVEAIDIANPWTSALHGKRVLLVHPFGHFLVERYHNLSAAGDLPSSRIYPRHPDALPRFASLVAYEPVNGLGNQRPVEPSWRAAYALMVAELHEMETLFDLALVSAGGWGHLLLNAIRHMDKAAIYVGGGLPVHFGVLGSRWQAKLDQEKEESRSPAVTGSRGSAGKLTDLVTDWWVPSPKAMVPLPGGYFT